MLCQISIGNWSAVSFQEFQGRNGIESWSAVLIYIVKRPRIVNVGPDGTSEIKITEKKNMVSDALEDPSPLGQAWVQAKSKEKSQACYQLSYLATC